MGLDSMLEQYFSSEEISRISSRRKDGKTPDFLDIISNLQDFADVLGLSFNAIKNPYLSDQRFLYMDIHEQLEQALNVFGRNKTPQIAQAILKQPNFLRINHKDLMTKKEDLGKYLLGETFSKKKLGTLILNNPHLICYSQDRDLASIEVGREIEEQYDSFPSLVLRYIRKSPRIPIEGEKFSISRARKLLGYQNVEMPEMYNRIVSSKEIKKFQKDQELGKVA